MNKLVCGLILGLSMVGAEASADTIEEAIGNVVVVRLADGTEERYRLNKDQTFTAELPEGQFSGTWAIRGSEICVDFGTGDEPVCEDYPKGKKLGDTWTEVDDDDASTLTISIEPGH